jgi:hypothetical protein
VSSYAVNPIKEGNMIAGHVIVKGTEESIPFATVMILGTNRGAVSNEEGQFEFRKLAAGKYTLRVQVMGYKTQEKTITVQRSRYNRAEVWTSEGEEEQTTKRMPRTPDYYGYFTFTSAPLKNFDFSLSGTYTGKMIVPHMAGYIEKSRMEHTPQFMDLNLKLNYTFVLKDHIKMQVNGGVQNIFNSFQKDLDKGEFRDAGYFYGPTQPRTYFVGIKIMN